MNLYNFGKCCSHNVYMYLRKSNTVRHVNAVNATNDKNKAIRLCVMQMFCVVLCFDMPVNEVCFVDKKPRKCKWVKWKPTHAIRKSTI